MITVVVLEDGVEQDRTDIEDHYVLVCAGTCHLDHAQVHANGTHLLTVKGCKARPGGAATND